MRRIVTALLVLVCATDADALLVEVESVEITGGLSFFDEFDDGLRGALPTALLIDNEGAATESGGALILSDADSGPPGDLVALLNPIPASATGQTVITTILRLPFATSAAGGVGLGGESGVLVANFAFRFSGGLVEVGISDELLAGQPPLGSDSFDPTGLGSLTLRLIVDHDADQV